MWQNLNKQQMRSKNHILYELYLEEEGATDLFNMTGKFSLGHIVKFVDTYNEFSECHSKWERIEVLTGKGEKDIEDLTDQDFNMYSTVSFLHEKLEWDDFNTLSRVIQKIDNYHENKTYD